MPDYGASGEKKRKLGTKNSRKFGFGLWLLSGGILQRSHCICLQYKGYLKFSGSLLLDASNQQGSYLLICTAWIAVRAMV